MNAASSNDYEVSVETAAGLERRMTVRVPAADIEREIDARLAKVGQTAKLKGFRPGKVPEKVVRQYYGGQVREEVLNDVIRASYSRAIAEQKLNPAGGPRIEPLAGADAAPRSTSAIAPRSRCIPRSPCSRSSSWRSRCRPSRSKKPTSTTMIEKLRAQRATWRAVERAADERRPRGRRFRRHDRRRAVPGRRGQGRLDRDRRRPGAEGVRSGAARRAGGRTRPRPP